MQYADDGSWTIVVAHRDPGHPNWVSPAGHPRGRIWFRWFYPSETPARPTTFSEVARSSNSLSTLVAERTISAS